MNYMAYRCQQAL